MDFKICPTACLIQTSSSHTCSKRSWPPAVSDVIWINDCCTTHHVHILCISPPTPCLPPSHSPLLYIQTHCPSSRLECGAEPCLDYQLRPLIKGIRNVTRSLKSDWTSVWAERWETSSSSRSAPLLYANYMGHNVGPLTPCSLSVQGWPCLLTQIKSTASSKGHFHAWPDQCPVGNGL